MTGRVAASLWSVPRDAFTTTAARLARDGVTRFHWDHADGLAAPAGGFDATDAGGITAATGAAGEAHLMLRDPRPDLAAWSIFCDVIAVQADQPHCDEAVSMIEELGARAVVAVTTPAQLAAVPRSCGVLVMSVQPGHAGTGFDEASVPLVTAAARAGHTLIGVDGSITPARVRQLRAAGATWFVSGTSLVSAPSVSDWLQEARIS